MECREIDVDELEALVEVLQAAQPREYATVDGFVDWRSQADAMAWFLCERAAETVGAAFVLHGWHSPPHRALGGVFVKPELRGGGVGDCLLDTIEGWAAERGARELDGRVQEDDAGSLGWAVARDYHEVGRNSWLVLDLTATDAPDPAPPEGIEIVTWGGRSDLLPGMYEVAREATRDIPGEEEGEIGSLEEWLARDLQGASDDADAVFVALEDDVVAGFAKLSLSPDSSERAFHDLTGVRRSHRGRGIAAALKRTQIAWAKSAGYHWLQTANEVRNEPIRRLNERHGYVVESGIAVVRGTISYG
ncbi:MAG TPA: GNAT family N-acetyltransferase [Gaiellaceae bacterium]|nr:GNAT family N-acetyltransferase [Gaiellaceae bacterium]